MYPIVNPYRDKERLANAEGGFVGKSHKGSPHVSSRALLALVLLVITGGIYYMHHVHNAHLLDNDKQLIRRPGGSFSESVKEYGDETNTQKGPPLDLRKKDDPSFLRTGKINTFNPTVVPVDAPYPPELAYKLRVQNRDAGAIEDKVIALATTTRNNEAMIAQKRAEIEAMRLAAEQRTAEQEEIRRAQQQREEAELLAAEQARTAKLIEERRAIQVAADEQAARMEAEQKAQVAQRAERAAAQQQADALLARRADEQRQAAIRAQDEETLRAAEVAAAANHAAQQENAEPVRKSQPPPDALVPEDAPIGVLAPPIEPARDVAPVGNVDPEPEPEHTVEEAAARVAAAMAAEINQGHPNVPPEEEDHHEVILPNVPHVPVVPSVPEAATAQVPDLAVPDLQHPVVALSPPEQAVIPPEPVIPADPAQPIPLAPPQGINPNPGAVEPVEPAQSEPERPMGFDLPPDKILKLAPAPVPAEVHPGEKIDYCAGNVDPFAAQPVELFKPPVGAGFELATQWLNAVRDMQMRVRKVTYGGEELRVLIRNEVDALKAMRFKMFCEYA